MILLFWFTGKQSWALALAAMGLPLFFMALVLFLILRYGRKSEDSLAQSHFAMLMGFETLATFFVITFLIYLGTMGLSDQVTSLVQKNILILLAISLISISVALVMAPIFARSQAGTRQLLKTRLKSWQILVLFLVIYFGLDIFEKLKLPIPQGAVVFGLFIIGLIFMFLINLYRDIQIVLYWLKT